MNRTRIIVLYIIFFLSGLAGLGYEIVWTRMFAVGLGHEMPSLLAVLAAFFGGFGLGALLFDRRISRSAVPGRWYASLELVISLWAIASIVLIPILNRSAADLIGLHPSAWRHWLISFAIPFIGLLPATAAMGATLAAIERLAARLRRSGRIVGGLYAVNTGGAVAGTLLAAFVIVPELGYTRTLAVFAAVNVICALGVGLGAARRERARVQVAVELSDTPQFFRIGVLVFATGFLGIGYEVVAVRAMGQVLENTVYSFASALSIYLVGTAIGAAVYQRFCRRVSFAPPLGWFLQLLALACLAGTLVLNRAGILYDSARLWLGGGVAASIAAEMFLALVVFFLPTLIMGATFSHLALSARRATGGIGHALGLNTFGASIAPVLFGVILMTQIGIKWTLVAVSLGYLPLLFLVPKMTLRRMLPGALTVPLCLLLPANLILVDTPPEARIIAYREGVPASVAVIETHDGHRSLKVNNRFYMGATYPNFAERRMAHIPLLLHPRPERVLFLGLGTGVTAGAATVHPRLAVTGVELLGEVIAVQPLFAPANRLSRTVPGSYIAADARRFVRASSEEYDVIIGDLFQPARDGAGALYTREHFEAVRGRLAAGGIFCQWLPLYQLGEDMVRLIVRTFLEVFPHATAHVAHFNVETTMLGLVGRMGGYDYGGNWYDRRVADAALAAELEELALTNELTLFGTIIAGTEALERYASDGSVNTDDRPLVIFRAPFFTYRKNEPRCGRLETFLDACTAHAGDILAPRVNPGGSLFADRLERYLSARNLYLRGAVEYYRGRTDAAVRLFLESVRTSAEFRTAYVACLELALDRRQVPLEEARRLLDVLREANPDDPRAGRYLQELMSE